MGQHVQAVQWVGHIYICKDAIGACARVYPALSSQVEANEESEAADGREDKGRRRSRRSKEREVVIALEINDRTISTVAEAEEGRPSKDKRFVNHRWLLPR